MANAIVKSMPAKLRFRRSNKPRYGSQIFAKKRPNADWYPPGNQESKA